MSLVSGYIRGHLCPTALEAVKVSWYQGNGSSTSHHGGKGLCPQQRQSCEICQQMLPEHRDKGNSEKQQQQTLPVPSSVVLCMTLVSYPLIQGEGGMDETDRSCLTRRKLSAVLMAKG